MTRRRTPPRRAQLDEPLSEAELATLQKLAAYGGSNGEIAAQLDITADTVKTHLHNVNIKLGATSRTQAVLAAIEAGLVPCPCRKTETTEEQR